LVMGLCVLLPAGQAVGLGATAAGRGDRRVGRGCCAVAVGSSAPFGPMATGQQQGRVTLATPHGLLPAARAMLLHVQNELA
jgi:hypothetical protein